MISPRLSYDLCRDKPFYWSKAPLGFHWFGTNFSVMNGCAQMGPPEELDIVYRMYHCICHNPFGSARFIETIAWKPNHWALYLGFTSGFAKAFRYFPCKCRVFPMTCHPSRLGGHSGIPLLRPSFGYDLLGGSCATHRTWGKPFAGIFAPPRDGGDTSGVPAFLADLAGHKWP